MGSAYWGEFRTHWRPLLAATMGLGFGIGLSAYTMSLFAPKLIAEFGWPRSQFALLGSMGLLMLIAQPITGRLTDRFGVRVVSMVGVLAGPSAYIAFAMQPGSIRAFFAIAVLQIVVGTLTTSPVYTRIVAERFERARGLAFSIVMTGPPLVGAVLAPLLGRFIESEGWRNGYLLMGGITMAFGLIAVAMTPPHIGTRPDEDVPVEPKAGYGVIVRNPAFWVLIIGMVLVNFPQGLVSAQMKLMLMDSGAQSQTATWLISIYAVGVMVGRFACGLSLDRMQPHHVAALTLSMPAIGMMLMASPFDATIVLALSVAMMGLAQGAEGDIAAYLVSRRFGLNVFSLVMGLVGASIAGGAALGAVTLSYTLGLWGSYAPFLVIGACVTLVGALLFLTLGHGARKMEIARA
ncbi:MFS family permease [Sphingobium xenophagum]|uniref:MFS family permease n=1 Tax=Sphingobium xenophagum TaxID=121428 RepID=A0ABU1WY04_SPHXE|nr:MFS transporter [Sphingobium xenophagum]MDR7154183.1 MFS family permease [Sphingobium xenophagum]